MVYSHWSIRSTIPAQSPLLADPSGVRGTHVPSHFHAVFGKNLAKWIGWRPPWGWHPPFGKSCIRHCPCTSVASAELVCVNTSTVLYKPFSFRYWDRAQSPSVWTHHRGSLHIEISNESSNLLWFMVRHDHLEHSHACASLAFPILRIRIQTLQNVKGLSSVVKLTHLKSGYLYFHSIQIIINTPEISFNVV